MRRGDGARKPHAPAVAVVMEKKNRVENVEVEEAREEDGVCFWVIHE